MKTDTTHNHAQILLVHGNHTTDGAPIPLQTMAAVLESHDACAQFAYAAEIDASDVIDARPAPFVVAYGIQSVGVVQALNGTSVPVLWWLDDGIADYSAPLLRQCPQHLFANVSIAAAGSWAAEAIIQRCPQYHVGELLIPTPVPNDTERFDSLPEMDKDVTTFVVTAPILPAQGQDVLLQAMELLSEEDLRKCRFVFVGTTEHAALGNAIATAATSSASQILVLSQDGPESAPSLLERADCVLCTARDEAAPMSVAAACQCGKAVICSDHTSMAPLIDECGAGLTYGCEDAQALADCIHTVLDARPAVMQAWQDGAKRLYQSHLSEDVFWQRLNTLMDSTRDGATRVDNEQQELAEHLRELEEQLRALVDLEAQVLAANQPVISLLPDYEHTLSWQITKPLRAIKKLLGIKVSAYALLSNLGSMMHKRERDTA